ncbi:urease accessory protein [Rhodoligotrophos appendicifer]|uniref:HupE/UreJ family protein n=1 Tax=Rhodoligotrophos appendicifer TaxID=987056 RepID=UPI003D16AE4A
MRKFWLGATSAALLVLPTAASAHTGAGMVGGFGAGILHPLTGFDHLLAMVLVGVLAYQLGGRALWLVPLAFVATMALGGGVAFSGMALTSVELGIALSIICLGMMVCAAVQIPLAMVIGLVAMFAVFHGHAHGAEMPSNMSAAAYASGFMVATAMLHAVGIALGYGIGAVAERQGVTVLRVAGGAASVTGLALLIGYI